MKSLRWHQIPKQETDGKTSTILVTFMFWEFDMGYDDEIWFMLGQTSLGRLLVAASDKGVVAILLGDDEDALARDLKKDFPRAQFAPAGDWKQDALISRVVGLVENPKPVSGFLLDIRGTAFQQRVWQGLLTVPVGQTATYAEIARIVGAPKSVRSIAGACAANRLAVAIPCHRIVGRGGALSSYRWGVGRRQTLLDRERAGVARDRTGMVDSPS